MINKRISQAREIAERARAGELSAEARPSGAPHRFYAIGDPQTRFDQFAAVLGAHELLGDDGWLRSDVGVVCVGDHFDFGAAHTLSRAEIETAGQDGLLILEWLAAHPAEQATVILGNHDAARLMELHGIGDDDFAAARDLALAAFQSVPQERRQLEAEFIARFDAIPTPELARRDFSTFHSSQREALQRLLTAGRICLAAVGTRDGEAVLISHAGFTKREREILGLARGTDARTIARSLNDWLKRRVARVAPLWEDGITAPLDLEPLHVAGVSGQEAGGFLSHRPANPERGGTVRNPDVGWEFRPERPRRFHPHDLPPGVVQACGHTRARSTARELVPWVSERAAEARVGELRSLRVRDRRIIYDSGLVATEPGDAVLYLIDADMAQSAPAEIELLEFSAVDGCGLNAG